MVPLLNTSQSHTYEKVIQAVYREEPIQFLIDSPGGYGKTFLFQAICADIRSRGDIALCVASTGLAAQNLEGGRTAHARFKIPIDIDDESTCNIPVQSALAKLIKNAKIIIWDEIFSIHRNCIEAVERTISDIINNEKMWGGLTICFGE